VCWEEDVTWCDVMWRVNNELKSKLKKLNWAMFRGSTPAKWLQRAGFQELQLRTQRKNDRLGGLRLEPVLEPSQRGPYVVATESDRSYCLESFFHPRRYIRREIIVSSSSDFWERNANERSSKTFNSANKPSCRGGQVVHAFFTICSFIYFSKLYTIIYFVLNKLLLEMKPKINKSNQSPLILVG
jgi:hypothetical protein